MTDRCELCEKDTQYAWRVKELENRVRNLYRLLWATFISSLSAFVGTVAVYLTK